MSTSFRKAEITSAATTFRRPFRLGLLVLIACGLQLTSSVRGDDPQKIVFLQEWGKRGAEPGDFNFPIAIAITKTDTLFVTDHLNNRVQEFDKHGKLLGHFAVLSNPGGIALDSAGNIYLTHIHASGQSKDETANFVSVYAQDGSLLRQWGKTGTGPGEFDCPGGIGVADDGRVYVADQTNHRVQVFDRMGKFLFQWGEYGDRPGQFGGAASRNSRVGGPQFLAFDSAGNVWTTEGANCRVQSFTAEGKLLSFWGSAEDKPGGFGGKFTGFKDRKPGGLVGPIGICFDVDDRLWISSVSGRVQQFSQDGKFLRGIVNEQGTDPGQFYAPHGMAFDSAGCLYVVDSFNHRIQKFDVTQ